MRILVVDDHDSIRMFLSEVLGEEGHTVTAAASAEEALVAFDKNPYPLVITDVRMGGMSGVELLQKIKQIRPSTLVIIITSHSSLDTIFQTFGSGAYDYLLKPFESIDQITKVVARATEKIQLTTPRILIVDDDNTAKKILVNLLNAIGCRVTEAENGNVGYNEFIKYPYPLVLLDSRCKNLLSAIKRLRPNTKVIALTTPSRPAQPGIDGAVCDYLVKPFTDLDRVAMLLNGVIKQVSN